MPIVTTDKGLAAIANAEAGGFLVDLQTFAVTEAPGVVPKFTDEVLEGPDVYRAEIQSIEVVNSNKVKLTLFIPPKIPLDGTSKKLTEVGLYLKTGELFAHGTFKTPFDKTNDYGLRIICFVVTARLGDVINFTFGTNASLASAASVRTLIDPTESDTNAVVVQDAQTNLDNVVSLTGGSLAVRYGAGGLNWAFLGYDLNYRGHATETVTPSLFKLNGELEGGFWTNHKEVVIVQVVAGHGSGESRRVQYDKDKGEFTVLEKPFSELSEQSLLHIWRSTKYALPSRTPEIEQYYVLGHGINTWKKESLTGGANAQTDLIPVRVSLKGDGAMFDFPMPANLPDTVYLDKSNFMVYVGGEYIPPDQYSVTKAKGVTLLSNTPDDGVAVEITVFKEIPSDGSTLILSTAEYSGDGTEWMFYTSIVPLSSDYLWVFVEGKLIATDQYTFSGSSVTFSNYAPNGNINIVSAGNLQELGAGTNIMRKEFTLDVEFGNVKDIDLEATNIDVKNTFVTVAGKLISQSMYTIDEGILSLKTSDYNNTDSISVVAFANSVEDVLVDKFSGENTGPVWIDPAGRYVETNRIQSYSISHVGDGSKTVYPMGSQGTFAFVFMDGTFQDPQPITIQSTNGVIILPQPLKKNMKMDIISFQTIPDKGQETKCERETLKTVAGVKRYMMTPPTDTMRQQTLVSISGVYQHLSTYTNDGTSIEFDVAPPPNLPMEFWHFGSTENVGFSNALSMAVNTLKVGQTEYLHEYYDAIPIFDVGVAANTALFANTVMQYGTEYSVSNDSAYKFNIVNAGSAKGMKATSFVFYTGKSKTRLMTRDEMKLRYMTRDEIMQLVRGGGVVLPPTDPTDPGGGDPGNGGEGTGAKALFLSSTSQIFAVTNETVGSPNTIVFTANAQNITGNIVFSVLAGDADISVTAKTATLPFATMRSDFATIRARVTDGGASYYDDITVVKLYEGKDAVTAILSNESHTMQADVGGIVTSYVGALTNMEIYRGSVRETDQWTFERLNSNGVASTLTRNQVAITSMTANQGYVDITASRNGFSPIVKRFSLAMSKTGVSGPAGAQGMGATYAVLSSEAFVFAASPSGVVTDFTQGKTEIRVIQNLVDETSKWVFTVVNSDGLNATVTGNVVKVNSFSPSYDTGSVTINATRTGYPALSKVFSLSKAKGSSGSGSSTEGPRGSMTFYVAGRTSWSDNAAAGAAAYGSGPRLNDTVVQYSTGFSQTRFWNGAAWVILNNVIDGNTIVKGTLGADALAANSIRANSAVIENGAIGTLLLGGNAVTLAQAVRQPDQNQISITYTGPYNPVSTMADPSANPVLSMIVTVTGLQPCLVWASWSNPGCYEVPSGGESTYWGKNWKMMPGLSECLVIFTMTNTQTGAVYKAGQLSSSVQGGMTLSMGTQAIFQNVPAGTYVLSLCMCKGFSPTLPHFAMRSASLAYLETKR